MNICTPGRSFMPRLMIVVAAALTVLVGARQALAQTEFVPYFGKNQIRYDNFEWQIYTTDHFEIYYYPEIEPHLEQDRQLRRERVSARQLRAEARPRLQGAADPLLDEQRVLAAERHPRRGAGRRRRVRRAEPLPHRHADGRTVGSALSAHRPRADPPVPVRHHPDLPGPPEHAAVGVRGHVGLHDRRLALDRPDDGARRRGRRHRAEDVRAAGLRRLRQRRA